MTNPYYREIEGDLFASGLQAIGHGCCCTGVMGAGIAKVFRERWPGMYQQYKARCQQGTFVPGDVMPWVTDTDMVVFNLATQPTPGPSATIEDVVGTVKMALRMCHAWKIPRLGIPRIGCGIGGLDWEEVGPALKTLASWESATELVVVSLPAVKSAHD